MNILNLPVGEVIEGHEILERLGEGYTGIVYRAQDIKQNRTVALKFLKTPEKDTDLVIRRFKDEFRKQLIGKSHPNICGVYQFGSFDGHLFFTSEYIKDYNIFVGSRGLPVEAKVKLFVQLLEGLDFIHRCGLLHLDIKAENVFLYGEPHSVKIIDFGLSALTGGEFCIGGTSHYIAPEVLTGDKNKIGAYSDLFSTAVLMYHCLTGAYPFPERWAIKELKDAAKVIGSEKAPRPPSALRKEIPEYLSTIIMRLLAKEPQERFYPNARAVLNALRLHQPDGFGLFPSPPRGEGQGEGIFPSYLRPIGNRHIGRTEIQTTLKNALAVIAQPRVIASSARPELVEGREAKQSPESNIFHLTGHFGLGKTHLLETLKEEVAVLPESVYVSSVSFPTDELAIETWAGELQRELSENNRSVLILADDVHNCNPEGKAGSVIQNIINTIAERKKSPDLYASIKPVMLVMADEPFEQSFVAERFSVPQDVAQDFSPATERYDWLKIAQNGGATAWEIEKFSKSELLEYLKSTPALKDKEISEKWLEHLVWVTSGFPADVALHLEEKDRGKMLFDLDGSLIVPYTIEPNMDEPSIEVTSLKWLPLPAKERLRKQYAKLEPLEREVVNLISVWNHRKVARAITEGDIIGFFYSPAIRQAVSNLVGKSVIASEAKQSPELHFTNPYMQSVVYEQLPQIDREAIHDMIAGYLKRDEDGILLHKGYGSDRSLAIKSLIKLIHKNIYTDGKLTLASALTGDALELIENKFPKLYIYLTSLLIEANQLSGNNSKNPLLFKEAFLNADQAPRALKTNLALKYIKTLLLERQFEEARSLISDLRSYYGEGRPIHAKLTNYEARSYLDESLVDPGKKEELLGKAEDLYKRTSGYFADTVQNNDLGDVFLMKGDYKSARQVLSDRSEAAKGKNIFNYLSLLLSLAETDIRLGLYDEAVKDAEKVKTVAKKTKQWRWTMQANRILAVIFYYKKDFNAAIKFDDRCFAAIKTGDAGKEKTELLHNLYIQRGHSLKELKKFDLAVANFEAVVAGGAKGIFLMSAYEGLGESNFYLKEFDKAKKYLDLAEGLLNSAPLDLVVEYKGQIEEIRSKLPV